MNIPTISRDWSGIVQKYGIPIYTTGGTADAMLRMKSLGKMPEGLIHEIREDEPFEIKDLTVNPFTIPHDAAQPVGYRLECGEHSVGIATDLGKYNDYIVKKSGESGCGAFGSKS